MKNISTYTFGSVIPYIILGSITIWLLSVDVIPLTYLWFTLIGWTLIAGLGVSVGYHKIFSHGAIKNLPVWKENVLLFLGTLSGQGSAITWAAIHYNHHKYSDTPRDLHSPVNGKWNAFFGWTLKITKNNNVVDGKPVVGCSVLVGSITARSYSNQDYWLTTKVTERSEEHTSELQSH